MPIAKNIESKSSASMPDESESDGGDGGDDEEDFIDEIMEQIKIILHDAETGNTDENVVNFLYPDKLSEALHLPITEEGETDHKLIKLCKKVIDHSVKTGHPQFFHQLYAGLDRYSLGASMLADTLNTSGYTYEMAPAFSLIEQEVLSKMRSLIGYHEGDGIFCPGGSIANMMALHIARYKRYPEVKTDGVSILPRLCIFTSDLSHYSMVKGASFLGFGTQQLRTIPTDCQGAMRMDLLESSIIKANLEGLTPFFVNATCGTTVYGSFDPLPEIRQLCDHYGMWMHADACWGGGCLLSNKYRILLNGIDKADTVSWCAHKMMGIPLQCSALLLKYPGLLSECYCTQANYLFQKDKFYDISYDFGDKTIQCSRKNDAFKLWMVWKAKGDKGFEKDIENIFSVTSYLTRRITETEGFLLVMQPALTNVCFWYIPEMLRNKKKTPIWWEQLGKVAPQIKKLMFEDGSTMVAHQADKNKVNFLRVIVSNLKINEENIDNLIESIEQFGEQLTEDDLKDCAKKQDVQQASGDADNGDNI